MPGNCVIVFTGDKTNGLLDKKHILIIACSCYSNLKTLSSLVDIDCVLWTGTFTDVLYLHFYQMIYFKAIYIKSD